MPATHGRINYVVPPESRKITKRLKLNFSFILCLRFFLSNMAPPFALHQTLGAQHNQTLTIHPTPTANINSTVSNADHASGVDIDILFQALTLALTVASLVIAYLQLWNMRKMGGGPLDWEETTKKQAR